jgi:glycosyltransferase involved in cell wall biosynthesis
LVFPVLNEEERMISGIRRILAYLKENADFSYQITIMDNGSEPRYQELGRALSFEYACVQYRYIARRGVGAALRTAFQEKDFDIIGYMDIDLSTPLETISEMYRKFQADENLDVFNASRVMKGACAIGRRPIREITSRGLNLILKLVFNVKFTDSMCGFKFFRAESLYKLLGKASDDDGWFYCAELLILAERMNFKIEEIPVSWVDNSATKVKIIPLAATYLRRIASLYIRWGRSGK